MSMASGTWRSRLMAPFPVIPFPTLQIFSTHGKFYSQRIKPKTRLYFLEHNVSAPEWETHIRYARHCISKGPSHFWYLCWFLWTTKIDWGWNKQRSQSKERDTCAGISKRWRHFLVFFFIFVFLGELRMMNHRHARFKYLERVAEAIENMVP